MGYTGTIPHMENSSLPLKKMEGKFRTNLKYGIFRAEKTPCQTPPPPRD